MLAMSPPQTLLAKLRTQVASVEASEPGAGVSAPVVVQPSPASRAPEGGNPVGEAWLWIGILIVVTVVGGLGLMWYRRNLLAAAQIENNEGFMESIRRLRASGAMSEEEFQAVRRNLIASIRAGEGTTPKRESKSEKF